MIKRIAVAGDGSPELILGTTSHGLTHHAHIPMVVVPFMLDASQSQEKDEARETVP